MENSYLVDEKREKRKYLVWGLLVAAYAINFFHSLSMGAIKVDLMAEFNMSETMFVTIASTYAYLYLLMQIPTGILADTIGARKTTTAGVLLSAIGIVLFAMSSSIVLLFIGRSMVGLGTSVIFVSVLKIQSTWFKSSQFGTMTGITCFVGALGGAVAQTPLVVIVNSVGWRSAFLLIGAVSLIIGIAIWIFVRDTPEELGYKPVEVLPEKENGEKLNLVKTILEILKNPRTWPMFFAYGVFYGSYVVIMGFWGIEYISSAYGISTVEASTFVTIGVIGSAVGAAVIGTTSDKLMSRKIPALVSGGLYLASWGILILTLGTLPLPALMVLMFVIGFMSCAYVVSWPCIKEVNNPKYVGISSAIANIGGFLGSIIVPFLVSTSLDGASNTDPISFYTKGFIVVLIANVLGFVATALVKETKCRNIYEDDH